MSKKIKFTKKHLLKRGFTKMLNNWYSYSPIENYTIQFGLNGKNAVIKVKGKGEIERVHFDVVQSFGSIEDWFQDMTTFKITLPNLKKKKLKGLKDAMPTMDELIAVGNCSFDSEEKWFNVKMTDETSLSLYLDLRGIMLRGTDGNLIHEFDLKPTKRNINAIYKSFTGKKFFKDAESSKKDIYSMKNIIVLQYDKKGLTFLKVYPCPKEQDEARNKFNELLSDESKTTWMQTQESFFDRFIEPAAFASWAEDVNEILSNDGYDRINPDDYRRQYDEGVTAEAMAQIKIDEY